jgi:phosphotransferase system enzyme I (PtsI)
MARRLSGVGATRTAGAGTAVWYATTPTLGDPPPADAVDPEAEIERFETAREAAREAVRAERERATERLEDAEAAVFDAHIRFLEDPQLAAGVEEEVRDGLPAEHAVGRTLGAFIERFEGMDRRTAERADDVRDVRDRLLRRLIGEGRDDPADLPAGSVLLAERLTPSDTARLDPDRVAGFATVAGGRTAHAAIFARSLGLPAVVGVGEELRDVDGGADIVVDGRRGEIVVDPDVATREAAEGDDAVEIRTGSVTTADGTPIEVAANVGAEADLDAAVDSGADGIGLFRTEFLFLDRAEPPDEGTQYGAYRDALEAFPDGRVVVRTLDVGGDKPLDYLRTPAEANPFLGERGIRRSLGPDADHFETQLRALLRAAATDSGGQLSVMLPLVATVEEVIEAQETMASVAADLDAAGEAYAIPELGAMVETPAAALLSDDLVDHVDFLSLGTNDLAQYVMAAERGNHRVATLADPRQPAVLRAIHRTVAATEGTDVWVGVCGEMAGDPGLTPLLVGLGIRELSAVPAAVPRVKRAVTEVRDAEARALAERALAAATRRDVAAAIDDFRLDPDGVGQ